MRLDVVIRRIQGLPKTIQVRFAVGCPRRPILPRSRSRLPLLSGSVQDPVNQPRGQHNCNDSQALKPIKHRSVSSSHIFTFQMLTMVVSNLTEVNETNVMAAGT